MTGNNISTNEELNKAIYVVISRTQTGFAKWIRRIGRLEYNHSAIGLDAELRELYAFSRPQHHAIFQARLVRETLNRYTWDGKIGTPVVVFKLPVSKNDYESLQGEITKISCDTEYLYNLFSVLTYPFTHGFETYKSYNCTEFVAHVLQEMKYPLSRPAYEYRPDDLVQILEPYRVFEGDLRDYMQCHDTDEQYFERYSFGMAYRNFRGIMQIIGRTYFHKSL